MFTEKTQRPGRISDALCAALQIINHLQDCALDYRNLDRVYIPLDRLAAAGSRVEALGEPRATPELLACLHDLAARTGALLEESSTLPAAVDKRVGSRDRRHPGDGPAPDADPAGTRSIERTRASGQAGTTGATRDRRHAGFCGRVRRLRSPAAPGRMTTAQPSPMKLEAGAAPAPAASSFYPADADFAVAPQREAMFEIYSFCRAVDDIADADAPRDASGAQLAAWRADIDALYADTGAAASSQVLRCDRAISPWAGRFPGGHRRHGNGCGGRIFARRARRRSTCIAIALPAPLDVSRFVFSVWSEPTGWRSPTIWAGLCNSPTSYAISTKMLASDAFTCRPSGCAAAGIDALPIRRRRPRAADDWHARFLRSVPRATTSTKADASWPGARARTVRAPRIMAEVYRAMLEDMMARRGWSSPRQRGPRQPGHSCFGSCCGTRSSDGRACPYRRGRVGRTCRLRSAGSGRRAITLHEATASRAAVAAPITTMPPDMIDRQRQSFAVVRQPCGSCLFATPSAQRRGSTVPQRAEFPFVDLATGSGGRCASMTAVCPGGSSTRTAACRILVADYLPIARLAWAKADKPIADV